MLSEEIYNEGKQLIEQTFEELIRISSEDYDILLAHLEEKLKIQKEEFEKIKAAGIVPYPSISLTDAE